MTITLTATLNDNVVRPRKVFHELERALIVAALDVTSGNITQAAMRIGIDRQSLQRKMTKYGLR